MIVHFIIAGVMANYGHAVSNVDGNANLTWEIKGSAGMTVIAFSYIFTGIYGFTWVSRPLSCPSKNHLTQTRPQPDGSTPPKSFP
jgi:hypothetical protein